MDRLEKFKKSLAKSSVTEIAAIRFALVVSLRGDPKLDNETKQDLINDAFFLLSSTIEISSFMAFLDLNESAKISPEQLLSRYMAFLLELSIEHDRRLETFGNKLEAVQDIIKGASQ